MDNNNDNNNNKGEILFWEVIHNKYLFQYIIRCIEIGEWCIYDGDKQHPTKNRIKFKNIDSLKWMINNKQYSLLKCKLEAAENIVFDSESLVQIYKLGKFQNGEHQIGLVFDKRSIDEIEMERTILFEAFQLLLKYQFNEMTKFDLYSIAKGNSEVIEILNNHNYPIQPNQILNEINNSPVSTVEAIINSVYNENSVLLVPDEIKDSSILHAFKNIGHRDEMLHFILNNNQLYNIPTPELETSIIDTIEKLEAHYIFYIKSKEIKSKLIQLNYFKPIDVEFISTTHGFKSISSQLIENLNQIFNNGGDGSNGYYINNSRSFYEQHDFDPVYITQNNILLEQSDIGGIYKYSLETFSSNALQYLLSIKGEKGERPRRIIIPNKDLSSGRSIKEISEFIKIYTNHFNYFETDDTNSMIVKMILSSTSNEQYQSLTSVISQNCENQNDNAIIKLYSFKTKPWGPLIYNDENVTKDESSIDWLVENNFNCESRNIKYKFTTFELFEYAIEKKFFTNQYQDKAIFHCVKIMKQAIYSCDVELFKKCQMFSNYAIVLSRFTFYRQIQINFRVYICSRIVNEDVSTDSIISFLTLINSFDGKPNSFSIKWKKQFFNIFLKKIIENQLSSTATPLSSSSSLSTLFKSIQLLGDNIELFSFYTGLFNSLAVQIFLENGFNPMKANTALFLECWEKEKNVGEQTSYMVIIDTPKKPYLTNQSGNKIYLTSNQSPDLIISFIQLLINQYNNDTGSGIGIGSAGVGSAGGSDYFKCIEIVINDLLKMLIRSKFTTIENVKHIGSFIINNFNQTFNFEHSIYHSYYYILLKSPRLLTFIMKLQSKFEAIRKFQQLATTQRKFGQLDFIEFIDPLIFTFEYLHGSNDINSNNGESFDNILDNLIQSLVYSPAVQHSEYISDYNQILQSTLIYLLEIKHYQSFFKQLEHIKQLLINSNIIIGNFPSIVKDSNNKYVTKRTFEYSLDLISVAYNNLHSDSFDTFIKYFN